MVIKPEPIAKFLKYIKNLLILIVEKLKTFSCIHPKRIAVEY